MSRKIDARELVAGLGGLLVLISLFLEWYTRDRGIAGLGGGDGITAWEAFEALDLLIAGLAIAAIATGLAALGANVALEARMLLPLGLALLIVVGVQLLSPPPVAWNADLGAGAWLALGGSLLVALGGLLRALRIDVTVNVGARETRQRVAAVDRRPAASPTPAPSPPAATDADPAPRRSLLDEPDPEATQPFKPVEDER